MSAPEPSGSVAIPCPFAVEPFVPAVLFLSIAATTVADQAAGGGEPIKIGLQREAGHRVAMRHGVGIIKEFIEIGAPATSLRRRPAVRRLLTYLTKHPDIRYVIVPAPHRFARTAAHARLLRGHLQRLGVRILLEAPDPGHGADSLGEAWA